MTNLVPQAPKASPAAATEAKSWLQKLGFETWHRDGFGAAVKHNFRWEDGNKRMAFARGAGVGVGAAMAGDALFRGKTADGEDRSALARVGEFVLGSGLAVTSLARGSR